MVNNKIGSKSKKAEVVEAEKDELMPITNDWNVSRIFWGLFFVIIGGLALFGNLGLVDVDWNNTWRLWPLLIIAAGISILSIKNIVWRIVSVILMVMMLGAVVWVMTGSYLETGALDVHKNVIQKTSGDVNAAEVNVKAGAISLDIGSADQSAIIKSVLNSNVAKITETSTIKGYTQIINLNMNVENSTRWWENNIKSDWSIDLNRNLPIMLSVDVGASDTKIDASDIMLRNANIKIGASSLELIIGKKVNDVDVSIDSGVSSIIIKVPDSSGVKLELKSGLTSKNIADLAEIDSSNYQSKDFDKASEKINIVAKVGMSSFTIERY